MARQAHRRKSRSERRPKTRNRELAHTEAKRYRIPKDVIEAIQGLSPIYGSQGRALQFATELLWRMPNAPVPEGCSSDSAMSYKLTPETIRKIDVLRERYGGNYGVVFAACVEILRLAKQDRITVLAKKK